MRGPAGDGVDRVGKIRHRQGPGRDGDAQRAFGFVLAAAHAHDKQHGASLALAGWSLAHVLSHLIVDGAFEGLPMKKQTPDTLARELSERLFG